MLAAWSERGFLRRRLTRPWRLLISCASHAVLSGPAVENIRKSVIKEVVVTNTIPLNAEADAARTEKGGKIHVLSIAGLIGRAIQANHEETSVSKLFM